MDEKQILVCGSIAYNNIMDFEGDFNDNLTTDKENNIFNIAVMPSTKTVNWGGCSGNISYNLGQLHAQTVIITAVGKDYQDNGYEAHMAKSQSLQFNGDIHQDLYTANAYIVNDKNHNQIIIFHSGAMIRCPEIKLAEKGISADYAAIAIVSPDNYQAMLNWAHELAELGIPFILDTGQVTPAFTDESLRDLIPLAKLVIGNEFEMNMILKKLDTDMDGLLVLNPTCIKTMGSNGSLLFTEGEQIQIEAAKPDKVVDPTGAGDGYHAGLLFGIVNEFSLEDACRVGSIVGSFVVETRGPQTQKFTLDMVKKRYQKTFGKPLGLN